MWRHLTANFSDLIFSVSEAMDLADSSLADHQIRTAFVSAELARVARLDFEQTERLTIAALLHDIGALSPEAKLGVHSGLDQRLDPHCLRGGKLLRETSWLAPSAAIVEWHHTPIKTHLEAGRSLADFDVLGAQILCLADHLEQAIRRDTFILFQVDELRTTVHKLAGTLIHADVVALFDQVSGNDCFWLELVARDLGLRLRKRNQLRSVSLDHAAARALAGVFKDMTDFRVGFTVTHSTGVAACACGIGEILGLVEKELQQLELAGLLHDIGKLVVPNAIFCKPAKLTPEEYAVIRQHPYCSYQILSRVRGFEKVAKWSGHHHERLDGSGYCRGVKTAGLDLGAIVLGVADIVIAMAERRPYREPGNSSAVLGELRAMARKGLLDMNVVEALADNYPSISARVLEAQAAVEARYLENYAMIS
ncbi:MAG: HD domain-containing protein [Rhodocyclaceae bacterium]|jgi:HD-GYP domain-containing protein (c-di-GMP phosphodiesterase class II)|nr:HD domain-containing protein [Rhodocyclaceae bacterium]